MELKKRIFDDKEVIFVCESKATQHGFKHIATMFIDGGQVWNGEAVLHYLNRTWERFKYECVMLEVIDKVLSQQELDLKFEFKVSKGISKLTEKYKEECEDYIAADETVRFFRGLYNDIAKTDNWMYA